MLLPGVLIAAFLTCWWLFCLIQAAFTPAREFSGLGKGAWVALIGLTFALGAVAWVIRCESRRAQLWLLTPVAHPALRQAGAPIGPDDDAEFLEMLGRRIRGTYEAGELQLVR